MHVHVRQLDSRARRALGGLLVAGAVAMASPPGSVMRAQGGPPNGLPPQASAQAEEQFEGELEALYEDSNTGARLIHGLRVGQQRFSMVYEDGNPPGLEDGTRVRVRGRKVNDNTLALKSGGSVEVVSALSTGGTFGEQRLLVMLVNFADNTGQPNSWATVQNTTFGAVNDFLRENSYNQTWLSGDVVGYYTLPMNAGGSCDYQTISSQADAAAAAAGVSVGSYTRKMYVFPGINCGWWGLGSVGGSPSRAWVNGTYALFVAAHELGHNFGNYHSRSQPCDVGGCSTIEYGDDHDIMGNIASVHTNAFQKERLGWLNYGGSPPIQTVTGSGTYTIDPMSSLGAYPKALKILKSGTTAGSRTYYYLEARTSYGFDAGAGSGVLIHTGSESSGNTSVEMDLAPSTSGFDSILDVDQTFTDSTIGLTVRTVAMTTAGASVEITLGSSGGGSTPSCTAAAPTVSLSPTGVQTTGPGEVVNYSVSVRNNDTTDCANTTFTLGASVPSGWTAGYDRASVDVTPGTTAIAQLSVTPSMTAAGSSSFTSSVARSGSAGPGGSTTGSVFVATSVSSVDVTVSASISRSTIQMAATARSGGAPVSGASVTFRITDPQGSVRTVSATTNASGVASGSLKLRPKDPKGTYSIVVTATASGVTGSASTSVVN